MATLNSKHHRRLVVVQKGNQRTTLDCDISGTRYNCDVKRVDRIDTAKHPLVSIGFALVVTALLFRQEIADRFTYTDIKIPADISRLV